MPAPRRPPTPTGRRSTCSMRRSSELTPSPVITLNRAVAVDKMHGPAEALAMIEPLAGPLNGYFHFFGLKGALLLRLGRPRRRASPSTGRSRSPTRRRRPRTSGRTSIGSRGTAPRPPRSRRVGKGGRSACVEARRQFRPAHADPLHRVGTAGRSMRHRGIASAAFAHPTSGRQVPARRVPPRPAPAADRSSRTRARNAGRK